MIYDILAESAPDDVIQTPGDVGVDLDAVEDAVMNSHDEEVEDAQEGMIGDPVEEFAMIMYESEYNYNEIMQAVGVQELKEAAMGRQAFTEAVDIKGFFKKIRDFFLNMFEKITKAVKDVLVKLDFQVKNDKKFITANKIAIKAGSANEDWSVNGYLVIKDLDKQFSKDPATMKDTAAKTVADIKALKSEDELKKALEDAKSNAKDLEKAKIAEFLGSGEAETMKEFKKAYKAKVFGSEEKIEITSANINVSDVISVLENGRETTLVRNKYQEIKKAFRAIFDQLNALEASYKKAENGNVYMTLCNYAISEMKIERNLSNVQYGVLINAARYKRALCRSLAHKFVKIANGKGKYKAKNESTSLFGQLNMI